MEMMNKEDSRRRIGELEQIASLRPTSMILADLAACYFTLDQPERALPLAQQAWAKNKNPAIGMNLALILKDLGRHEESFHAVEGAYWLHPEDFYIKLGYGEALLRAGFWKQAWAIYDNSRPTQQGACYDLRLDRSVREWKIGETLPEGHLLLVINEGGTGDRILYPRWLDELTRRGVNWVFYPYSELMPFFERIYPKEKLIRDGDDINPTHWTTSFAVPAKLNIAPSEIPAPLPLTATAESIAKYKMARPNNYPIVGICYAAAEAFQGDRKVRSLSEGQALRLVCMTGDVVNWVSLQHGKQVPYPVANVPFQTWEDTVGLMENLDGVVTVDTGVMHFAGSLRRPMATLLSGNSCWKFGTKYTQCKLYPTSTLFRNEGAGFENAIDKLVAAIRGGFFKCGTAT